jgi:hypothetical protein
MVCINAAYIKTSKLTAMKTYEKAYIGKGKQIKDMQIIRISLKIEDILSHAHEYKGEQYLTFEVAKLQSEDRYENTHTVYVNKMVEETASQMKEPSKKIEKPEKKTAKRQKNG